MEFDWSRWILTGITGALGGLLLWYFVRSINTIDKRLDAHSKKLESHATGHVNKVEFDASQKQIDRRFITLESEVRQSNKQFSAEMKQEFAESRREFQDAISNMNKRLDDHGKKHDERLDRMIMLITKQYTQKGD